MAQIHVHDGDIPDGLDTGAQIGIDTETLGLIPARDALCLVQICVADGDVHLVRMDRAGYPCPRLKRVLTDASVLKIFHYARFDMAMLRRWLGIDCAPIYCTKIASKLARTYTDRHGLKDLVREVVGKDISKAQQCSDWGAGDLSQRQLDYAAQDVLHLGAIREQLAAMLAREGRTELAAACFDALAMRVALDLAGWADHDIFAH